MPFAKLTDMYAVDGKDHVRIFHRGATEIGVMLSINAYLPFHVEGAGKFGSARCFVYWLATGDEEARFSKNFRVPYVIPHYSELILYGKYLQLKGNIDKLIKEFKPDIKYMMYRIHDTGIREVYDVNRYTDRVVEVARKLIQETEGRKVKFNWNNKIDDIVQKRIIEIGEHYAKQNNKVAQSTENEVEEEQVKEKTCETVVEIVKTEEKIND